MSRTLCGVITTYPVSTDPTAVPSEARLVVVMVGHTVRGLAVLLGADDMTLVRGARSPRSGCAVSAGLLGAGAWPLFGVVAGLQVLDL